MNHSNFSGIKDEDWGCKDLNCLCHKPLRVTDIEEIDLKEVTAGGVITLSKRKTTKQIIKNKLEEAKIPRPDDWHRISQAEANKQKNFNAGLQKAIEIVEEEM